MKTKYYGIFIFILIISGCDKDNDHKKQVNINIPVGSIVADIDGKQTTFNVEAIADTITEPFDFYSKIFRLEISGKSNTLSNSQIIKIKFWAKPVRAIGSGTYPDFDKQIYNSIDFIDRWTYSINGYDPYLSKGTIVRNDSIVQGIFSGKLIIGIGPGMNEPQPPLSHSIETECLM